jgi:selenocysteine-specific elongation factor
MLPNAPKALKDRARVRVHLGTAEILGRIRLLDARNELPPDERAYVQLRGEAEFACARGDRFVVRSYSPMTTIGGGFVLDAAPGRHRKNDVATLASLAAKERGTPEDLLETVLQRCPVGLLRKDAPAQSGLTPADAQPALDTLIASGKVVLLPGDRLFHADILTQLTDRARAALEAYHKQFPLRTGMPKEELRAALGRDVDGRAFTSLLTYWQTQDLVMAEGATVRLADFQVELNERQQNLMQRIEEFYRECDIATPTIEEVCAEVKAPPDAVNALLRVGVEQGRFARVADGVHYQADTLARLQQLVRDYVAQHGSITVAAFRDLTNSNRKFSLQALEYFDSIRFTRRQGDERVLSSP